MKKHAALLLNRNYSATGPREGDPQSKQPTQLDHGSAPNTMPYGIGPSIIGDPGAGCALRPASGGRVWLSQHRGRGWAL